MENARQPYESSRDSVIRPDCLHYSERSFEGFLGLSEVVLLEGALSARMWLNHFRPLQICRRKRGIPTISQIARA